MTPCRVLVPSSHSRPSQLRGGLLLQLLITCPVAQAQLAEVENAGTWVLAIFSPAILLIGLTILLIGCGLAVWFGRMTGGLFVKILLGSILVFGARTIAPQLVAAFA